MLPCRYLITPEPEADDPDFAIFLATLDASLAHGIGLVQLRAKTLSVIAYEDLAARALPICRRHGALLMLNAASDVVARCGAHGRHLNGAALCATDAADGIGLQSAATHSLTQIRRAETVGVDFVTLSPVLPTATHPEAPPLGWQLFSQLCASTRLPVYALGGLDEASLALARSHGAHGIAAIRAFWRPSH